MFTKVLMLASLATLTWLLTDESRYRRTRNWLRARFGGHAPNVERLRDEAAEMAEDLRAVSLGAAHATAGGD